MHNSDILAWSSVHIGFEVLNDGLDNLSVAKTDCLVHGPNALELVFDKLLFYVLVQNSAKICDDLSTWRINGEVEHVHAGLELHFNDLF